MDYEISYELASENEINIVLYGQRLNSFFEENIDNNFKDYNFSRFKYLVIIIIVFFTNGSYFASSSIGVLDKIALFLLKNKFLIPDGINYLNQDKKGNLFKGFKKIKLPFILPLKFSESVCLNIVNSKLIQLYSSKKYKNKIDQVHKIISSLDDEIMIIESRYLESYNFERFDERILYFKHPNLIKANKNKLKIKNKTEYSFIDTNYLWIYFLIKLKNKKLKCIYSGNCFLSLLIMRYYEGKAQITLTKKIFNLINSDMVNSSNKNIFLNIV